MTTRHGCDPEDGDLVQPPPPVEVPDDVAEAVRTLIRRANESGRIAWAAVVPWRIWTGG